MRQLGYNVIYFVQLIRFFGFSEATSIFLKIIFSGKNALIHIKSKKFKNVVQVRKATSDLPIFYQVFCELQYDMNYYLKYKPKSIIDAGSNVGYSCLYFASLFPDASIVAIEPEPGNFKQLKLNTANYKNIKPQQAAIWHQKSSVTIKNEDEMSASFEVQEGNENKAGFIQGLTIDEIAADNKFDSIDIIKIDIEGAEYNVFANNPHGWLSKTRCVIIELHDLLQPGTSQVFFREMAKYKWNTFIKGENIISFKAE